MSQTQERKGDMSSSTDHHHFVLVHGAGHGAWCWYKVRRLLEESGHKVTCLDLAGGGINRSDPDSILTFEQYNEPLMSFFSALPQHEKVVLVGHSAGGLSVTQATRRFGDRIKVAIYVAATMLRSGFCSVEDLKQGAPNLSPDQLQLNFGLGSDLPPTTAFIPQVEAQRDILYHLSRLEDSTLASMLLRPWPLTALVGAKFEGGDENVDRVRRVYVKAEKDRMVRPEQQEAMVAKWPPSEVVVFDADHCPFFSASGELCRLLVKSASASEGGNLNGTV